MRQTQSQRPRARWHTIILVEDDQLVSEALRYVLHDEHYHVLSCSDGAEALERLRAGAHPDLILLDLKTPRMDGWEFCSEQRKHPDWRAIPVVALTACTSREAQPLDVDAFLAKPVDAGTLRGTIRGLLQNGPRERILVESQRMARADDLSPRDDRPRVEAVDLAALLASCFGSDSSRSPEATSRGPRLAPRPAVPANPAVLAHAVTQLVRMRQRR